MAQQVQFRRGTTGEHSTFTGAIGEVTVDIDKDVVVVHDGSTAGGFPLIKESEAAKTASSQTFTAGQRGEITALTNSAGSVTIDFNDSNNFYLSLDANVTSITLSNATAGQTGSIFIAQTGSYTVGGWPAAAKFSGGTAPTITATSGKYDRIDYAIYDSSNVQLVWTGNY